MLLRLYVFGAGHLYNTAVGYTFMDNLLCVSRQIRKVICFVALTVYICCNNLIQIKSFCIKNQINSKI